MYLYISDVFHIKYVTFTVKIIMLTINNLQICGYCAVKYFSVKCAASLLLYKFVILLCMDFRYKIKNKLVVVSIFITIERIWELEMNNYSSSECFHLVHVFNVLHIHCKQYWTTINCKLILKMNCLKYFIYPLDVICIKCACLSFCLYVIRISIIPQHTYMWLLLFSRMFFKKMKVNKIYNHIEIIIRAIKV